MSKPYIAFLDGVTGFLGRWTLFWYLEQLQEENIAVLIRPQKLGDKAQADVDQRLDQILAGIGMSSERHRVTAIPGNLNSPFLGNAEALNALQADCWFHIAGDVTFKKLGDKRSLSTNVDYTINFVEAAAQVPYTPQTVCHTSTFYVFEKANDPSGEYVVPEAFHDPAEMDHHNAYGYSKLKAESYLKSLVEAEDLPFDLLVFRPDIIMHHIPVEEVVTRNPGLIVDDFKVVYQLLAAVTGQMQIKIPNGPTIKKPLKYLPVCLDSVLNISDVDSVTKAMMQVAVLASDQSYKTEHGFKIFQFVNRWQPISTQFIRNLVKEVTPDVLANIELVSIQEYQEKIVPSLSWAEQFYYGNLIDPFLGYMHRATTHAITANVDELLGEDWHNFHPRHNVNQAEWLTKGALQAFEKDFGQI